VFTFDAEPHDEHWARVSVGGYFVPWAHGRQAFKLSGDTVLTDNNESIDGHVATFLEVRSPSSPFWLALGAGTDGKSIPSYYLGVDWRPSDVVGAKLNASLGIGLVSAETVVGVSGTAPLQPLPKGKTLDDLLIRERRYGLGVMFSVAGIDFSPK